MQSIETIKTLLAGDEFRKLTIKDSDGNDIVVTIAINNPICMNEFNGYSVNKLPKQYVELLAFANGMELYNYDNIDGIKLLSLDEVQSYTQYAKNIIEEKWQESIIIFGKIIGEDNYLAFRVEDEGYVILDCYFDEIPENWKAISNDFDTFLLKYLVLNGEKYWL